MKRKILLLSVLGATYGLQAQVGINNTDPQATLDIMAKTTDGTKPEGVLIPRLTAIQVGIMTETTDVIGTEQDGLTVYVTEPFEYPEDQTEKYELIDSRGYYYYDSVASKWKKLLDSYNAPTGLEKITESQGSGWRLIGRDPNRYGDIGDNAVDLSYGSGNTQGATGAYSVAMGAYTTASGLYSVVSGYQSTASGVWSVAMGYSTVASGDNSFAFGGRALEHGTFAVGGTAKGLYSVAIGQGVETSGEGSVALGRYNIDNPNNLLSVGGGDTYSRRNNTFVISRDGKVAVGKEVADASSEALFQVNGLVQSETINTQVGGATDRIVVADENGVFKTIDRSSVSNIRTVTSDASLLISDNNGYVYVNSSQPVSIDIPADFPIGFSCVIVQKGVGQVTVTSESSISLETARGTKTRKQYSAIGAIKDTDTSVTITGDAVN